MVPSLLSSLSKPVPSGWNSNVVIVGPGDCSTPLLVLLWPKEGEVVVVVVSLPTC